MIDSLPACDLSTIAGMCVFECVLEIKGETQSAECCIWYLNTWWEGGRERLQMDDRERESRLGEGKAGGFRGYWSLQLSWVSSLTNIQFTFCSFA